MAFNSITIGSQVFNSIGNGMYSLSTVGLNDPANGIKLSPGKKSSANSPTTASVTRYIEVDVTVSGVTTRKRCAVTVQLSVPKGFTSNQVDTLLSDISTFVDATTATRLLLGES